MNQIHNIKGFFFTYSFLPQKPYIVFRPLLPHKLPSNEKQACL